MTHSIFTNDITIQNLKEDFITNFPKSPVTAIVKINTKKCPAFRPSSRMNICTSGSGIFSSFTDTNKNTIVFRDGPSRRRDGSSRIVKGTFEPLGVPFLISSSIVGSPKNLCRFISTCMVNTDAYEHLYGEQFGNVIDSIVPLTLRDLYQISIMEDSSGELNGETVLRYLSKKYDAPEGDMAERLFDWIIAVAELYFVGKVAFKHMKRRRYAQYYDECVCDDADTTGSLDKFMLDRVSIIRETGVRYLEKKHDSDEVREFLEKLKKRSSKPNLAEKLDLAISVQGIDATTFLQSDIKPVYTERGGKWLKYRGSYNHWEVDADDFYNLILAQYVAPWDSFWKTGYRKIEI